MNKMIEMGVDNILTDDPALLIEVRRRRQSLTPVERLMLAFRHL